jgi:hypothetical protein
MFAKSGTEGRATIFREALSSTMAEAVAGLPQNPPTEDDPLAALPSVRDGRLVKGEKQRRFTRNTEQFCQRVTELVEVFGFKDPLVVMMEIATGKQLKESSGNYGAVIHELVPFDKMPDHKTRVLAATELASYMYPKRKAVEVTGAEGQPITFAVHADNAPLPEMPSDEEIAALQLERRKQAAAEEARTIDGQR